MRYKINTIYDAVIEKMIEVILEGMRKRSEMIKKLVISQKEGIIEGMIEDILINIEQNIILGWSFRREGFFSSQGFVSAEDSFLGKDVLLVQHTKEMPNDLEDMMCWGKDLIKNPIIDRLGKEVGYVADLIFNLEKKGIESLVMQEKNILLLGEDISVRSTVVVIPQDCVFHPLEEEKEESWWNRFWNGFS